MADHIVINGGASAMSLGSDLTFQSMLFDSPTDRALVNLSGSGVDSLLTLAGDGNGRMMQP